MLEPKISPKKQKLFNRVTIALGYTGNAFVLGCCTFFSKNYPSLITIYSSCYSLTLSQYQIKSQNEVDHKRKTKN
jgi:hypothetical protein